MTPTEKVKELMGNMEEIFEGLEIDHEPGGGGWIDTRSKNNTVKKCALIAVDEIISEWSKGVSVDYRYEAIWWKQVKDEILKL